MTKQYYECHITMTGNPLAIKAATEKATWKFSAIDGDSTLGDGVKCYATKHFNTKFGKQRIVEILNSVSGEITRHSGATVIRKKIELVVHDDRAKT